MPRDMKKGAAAPAMPRAEALKFWEGLVNTDMEAAKELFWHALMRDARADYAHHRAANIKDADDEDGRRARVFEPRQPPPHQQPAVTPSARPAATVLGLGVPPPAVQTAASPGLRGPPPQERPPHLTTRKHEWTPSASGAPLRPPEGNSSTVPRS
ncbi:hypothetical protein ACP70R_014284 [Stipagrostis hirtigluma subsp. patula]